ncbi:zf-HC2 domain-containing protein [Mycobacterium sp. B14F4]|uniref:anti-sigma factor family protein n=1 Tax=Mycobacterium sp. B14F4 TaxID=3153565 RepID=UPI00325DDFC7
MSVGPMDCNELVELVTAYLDDALDTETRARVEAHLADCEGCANYVEQFRQTVRTVGRITDDQLDPAFRSRLLGAFKNYR